MLTVGNRRAIFLKSGRRIVDSNPTVFGAIGIFTRIMPKDLSPALEERNRKHLSHPKIRRLW
jgi:hypothetical protein